MSGRIDNCMDDFHMLLARDDDNVMLNDVVFVYVILLLVLMKKPGLSIGVYQANLQSWQRISNFS